MVVEIFAFIGVPATIILMVLVWFMLPLLQTFITSRGGVFLLSLILLWMFGTDFLTETLTPFIGFIFIIVMFLILVGGTKKEVGRKK